MLGGADLTEVVRASATTPMTVNVRPSVSTWPPITSPFGHRARASDCDRTMLLRLRSRDTERERQKRGQCESRSFQQQTAREAQIFRELLKTVPAPRFTAIFLLKRHVSKLLMNLGTGFFLAHSLLHQVVDLFLDMRGHFGGEIAIHSPSFEPAPYWIHDSEGPSTRPMPTSKRSNPAISRCSCLRPPGGIL
jgi:hypothetical protein